RTSSGEGGQSSSRSGSDTGAPPPSPPRKPWQVAGSDRGTPRSPAPAPRPSVTHPTPRPSAHPTPVHPSPASRASASPAEAAPNRGSGPAARPGRKGNRAVQTMQQPAVVTHEVTEEHLVEENEDGVVKRPMPKKQTVGDRGRTLLAAFRALPPRVRYLVVA